MLRHEQIEERMRKIAWANNNMCNGIYTNNQIDECEMHEPFVERLSFSRIQWERVHFHPYARMPTGETVIRLFSRTTEQYTIDVCLSIYVVVTACVLDILIQRFLMKAHQIGHLIFLFHRFSSYFCREQSNKYCSIEMFTCVM